MKGDIKSALFILLQLNFVRGTWVIICLITVLAADKVGK